MLLGQSPIRDCMEIASNRPKTEQDVLRILKDLLKSEETIRSYEEAIRIKAGHAEP